MYGNIICTCIALLQVQLEIKLYASEQKGHHITRIKYCLYIKKL